MKLLLAFVLALSTRVFGQETFSPKCDCHADNFMAMLHDERRCLTLVDPNGLSDCLETDWDSTHGLECTKCAPTHAIDEKKRCIPHELPECIVGAIKTGMGVDSEFPTYTDGFVCTECNTGFFVNKEGWCTANPTAITNCTVYVQNGAGVNDTACDTCATGFWLQQDDKTLSTSCKVTPADAAAGIVDNCKTYNNADGTAAGFTCTECNANFWLQQDDKGLQTSCAASPADAAAGIVDNCKTYNNADGTAAGFTCTECNANFWLQQDDKGLQTSCAATPADAAAGIIDNCKTYNNADGTAAGFTCTECNEGFWIQVDDKSLQTSCPGTPADAAAGKIDNCDKYINADGTAAGYTCDECAATFIINTAADTCWATPIATTEASTWTENCKTWSHPTTKYQCIACESHTYLDTSGAEPKCSAVQLNIDNCITYSDAQTCTHCAERYWLEDGVCVQCPAEKYVAPTPVVCNGTTTPTNGTTTTNGTTPTNGTTGGTPTNGTTTNSVILSAGVAIALSLVLL